MAFESNGQQRMRERRQKAQRVKMAYIAGAYFVGFAIGGIGLAFSVTWLISIGLIVLAVGLVLNLFNPSLHDFSLTDTKGNGGIAFKKKGRGDD